MSDEKHYRALENMYLRAPVNEIYKPQISITLESAEIEIEVTKALFHSGGAVHGSVYFKMLDDAAYFAVSSIITDFFAVTTTFTTYLTRPVSSGRIRSVGKVVNKNRSQFIAEAIAYNDKGKEIGRGNGIFVKSKLALTDVVGYVL
jgi:uncharacterized protein (TIGR00369 family)